MGKSTINGQFSIATLNYQRVSVEKILRALVLCEPFFMTPPRHMMSYNNEAMFHGSLAYCFSGIAGCQSRIYFKVQPSAFCVFVCVCVYSMILCALADCARSWNNVKYVDYHRLSMIVLFFLLVLRISCKADARLIGDGPNEEILRDELPAVLEIHLAMGGCNLCIYIYTYIVYIYMYIYMCIYIYTYTHTRIYHGWKYYASNLLFTTHYTYICSITTIVIRQTHLRDLNHVAWDWRLLRLNPTRMFVSSLARGLPLALEGPSKPIANGLPARVPVSIFAGFPSLQVVTGPFTDSGHCSLPFFTLWLCQNSYWTWPSRNSGFSH